MSSTPSLVPLLLASSLLTPAAVLAQSTEEAAPPVAVVAQAADADAHETATGTGTDPADDPAGTPDAAPADAPEGQPAGQATVDELERRIDVLAAELEQMRSGEAPQQELTEERQRALGLAPSAAAAYSTRGLSFAGYGEMLYENRAEEDQRGVPVAGGSQLDFLRAIVYTGYRFNDRFVFNSEIEVEHANEIFVEFAYVDYLVNDALTVRGGMVLLPLGLVNEFHEPNVFLGAKRPQTESVIIPSTWRENGAGVLGSAGPVSWRAYVVNGLDASGFSAGGLRGGRQKGSKAKANDLAFAGRVDVSPMPGAFVGAGLYAGGSGQGELTVDGRVLDVGTTIAEVHGQVQMRGWDVRGLFARASLGDVPELNEALGLEDTGSVAETLQGGYLQVAYDVLSQSGVEVGLSPYYRFENVDTHADVAARFTRDPARNVSIHTLGVQLQPIYNVVIKSDYQWWSNDAETGRNQFNIALGYAF